MNPRRESRLAFMLRGATILFSGMLVPMAAAGLLILATFHIAAIPPGPLRSVFFAMEVLFGAPLMLLATWIVLRIAVRLMREP